MRISRVTAVLSHYCTNSRPAKSSAAPRRRGQQQHTTRAMAHTSAGSDEADTFAGKTDLYRGVTVLASEEPCPGQHFEAKLQRTLHSWEQQGVRAAWFKMDAVHADWVPVLAKNGFAFHHADGQGNLAMNKWLAKGEVSQIPQYAHHMVGVGGMVVNDNNELLVVKERFRIMDHFKLPGGYVDAGEDIADAAIREVKEETGIDTEFVSLIAARQGHRYNFGCSDLYFVCHLRPLTSEIHKCPAELKECKWMPIEEFVASEQVNDINKFFAEEFVRSGKRSCTIALTSKELRLGTIVRPQKIFSLKDKSESKL